MIVESTPAAYGSRGRTNEWRARIGEDRIIYEINDRAVVITVLNVDKRSDAYSSGRIRLDRPTA